MDRESQWSGQYVAAGRGSTVTWTLPAGSQPRLVQPVVGLAPGSTPAARLSPGVPLGTIRYGDVGPQGNAPAPIELMPIELPHLGRRRPRCRPQTAGGTGAIDALLVMPEVATLLTDGGGHSRAADVEVEVHGAAAVALGGSGRARVVLRPVRPAGRQAVDHRVEPGGHHRARRLHRPHPLRLTSAGSRATVNCTVGRGIRRADLHTDSL